MRGERAALPQKLAAGGVEVQREFRPRADQTLFAVGSLDTTTFFFEAAGNQQVESGPSGVATNVWDCENMQTAVLFPNGTRQTMTYNANLRQHLREV